jgi:photosystem II stability/assembly factor-like uncharacterized protein
VGGVRSRWLLLGSWLSPAVWALGCCSDPPPSPPGPTVEGAPPASTQAPRPAGEGLCSVAVPSAAWSFAGGPKEALPRQLAVTDDAIFVASPKALRRSDDGGQTWSVVEPPYVPNVATRLAGVGGELFFSTGLDVVRSADGGRSWDYASSGLDLSAFMGLRSLYVDGDNLLGVDPGGDLLHWSPAHDEWTEILSDDAGPVGAATSDGATFLADVGVGVCRSTDLATWQLVEGLDAGGYRDLYIDGDLGLAIALDGEIWRSSDAGLAWTPIPIGADRLGAASQIVRSGDSLYAVTTHGIARSTDEGTTWLPALDQPNADAQSHLASAGDVLAADVGRIVASLDGGHTWNQAAPIHDVTLVTFGAAGSSWFASTEQRSVFVSTNAGASWHESDVHGYILRDVEVDEDATYLLFSSRLPTESHDGYGPSFISRRAHGATDFGTLPLPPVSEYAPFDHMLLRDGALFVGATSTPEPGAELETVSGAGVWVTHDDGATWTPANTGLPSHGQDALGEAVLPGVLALEAMGESLVVLFQDRGLYLSEDAGMSWLKVATGSDLHRIDLLDIVRDGVVLGSRDSGANQLMAWSRGDGLTVLSAEGLPKHPRIETLVAHENLLFAAIHLPLGVPGSDIYVSADGGDHWQPLGLEKRVRALSVQGNSLLAGAQGEAIWTLPLGACVD